MSREKLNRIILILVFLVLATACLAFTVNYLWVRAMRGYSSPPEITIINASGTALQDVAVEGRGFREVIGRLPEGAQISFDVTPAGESSLKIEFAASGHQFIEDDLTYLEPKGGYWATLTITEDYVVEVDSGLNPLRR
jgi:hypothetical protein